MASVSLVAFGGRGYGIAASNMVLSLRHHGWDGDINLHTTDAMWAQLDEECKSSVVMHRLPADLVKDPGRLKARLPSIVQDRSTLFLDVDGIALKDITPLVRRLEADQRPMLLQCAEPYTVGSSDKPDGHWWVSPKVIAERMELEDGTKLYACNSSAVWMRKGEELDELQSLVLDAETKYTYRDLSNKWGRSIPDELLLTSAIGRMGFDPSLPEQVCYFDRAVKTVEQIAEIAYILPMYGSGRSMTTTPQRIRDMYDGQVRLIRGRRFAAPYYASYVMRSKFIDKT